ncbi:hypothetical protein PLICRDRAFT_439573 [Plicaturopsis crispa FD-325 SS-3]|uniref:Uncharacterized protein n=1 Tax=Plicaturopsis crispa FD-325 SS-3 TaxID=944288 RepID=A0A0C9SKH2_PLICR|nr:hypothetical protein PLICRDRAFT_439573 [Plicaturopsis crispa FD-325 SS-3]
MCACTGSGCVNPASSMTPYCSPGSRQNTASDVVMARRPRTNQTVAQCPVHHTAAGCFGRSNCDVPSSHTDLSGLLTVGQTYRLRSDIRVLGRCRLCKLSAPTRTSAKHPAT